MNTLRSFVNRHALVLFFGLAYALSWWGNLYEAHSMFPLGPLLAALLVLSLTTGRAGLADFLRRIVQWRVGVRWYALVIGLPITIVSVAIGLNLLLGAQIAPTLQMPPLADLVANVLVILIFIGVGEEPAWRGFALPRFMQGRSTLAASLLLGICHAIWHWPLFGLEYDWQNGAAWLLLVMAYAIITAWLYNQTAGNLLLPALFHTTQNMVGKYLFNPAFSGAELIQLWWLMAILWCLVAGVIVLVTGANLSRPKASVPSGLYTGQPVVSLLIGLGLLFALIAPTTALAQSNPEPVTEQTLTAIDAYLETQMQELRIPGLALGIVQGDQIVHLKSFGIADPTGRPVTPQTPFILNSISKSFAALAVMQLVEAGKIELDAPVQRYLPWFRVADEMASAQITVRHLLNQTSGLPESASYADLATPAGDADSLEGRVRRLHTTQLNRPVGASFEYTDANYDVLGLIVQSVAGQPYSEYMQQKILTPLAMKQSETTRPDALPADLAVGYRSWFGFPIPYRQWYAHASLPSGDLISNAEEMTHYLIAQLNDGRYNGAALLSTQGIATLHQPAVREAESEKFYGMGWEVRPMNDLTVVRHDGTSANYYADMVLDPTGRWGIVILLNLNSFNLYGGRLHALTGGVMSLLHGQTPPTLPAMHHPLLYPIMLVIWAITGLLLLWMGWMVLTWRRWRQPAAQAARGWWHGIIRRLPSLLTLVWALLLLVGIPQVLYPLSVMLINIPDFGYTVLVAGGVALGCGALRRGLMYLAMRTPRTPILPTIDVPVSAPVKA